MKTMARWGVLGCAGLAGASAFGAAPLGLLELIFLLAAWVIVPLGIPFLPQGRVLRMARFLLPAAAVLASVSFFLEKGRTAFLFVVPWIAVDGLLAGAALVGLRRTLKGGLGALLLAAAMILPVVGGIHLGASRLGYPLGGFPEPIILLTAIHFHYIAFAAPILAAITFRTLPEGRRRASALGGLGTIAALPLIAAGFLGSPSLKIIGVGLMTASVLLAALSQLQVLPEVRRPSARLLLALSSAALLAAIVLAAIFEHGVFTGRTWISIPRMAQTHGLLNSLGFSLGGLLAWTLERAGLSKEAARSEAPLY